MKSKLTMVKTTKIILTIYLVLSSISQYTPQVIAQTKKTTTTKQPFQPSKKPTSLKKTASPKKPVYVPPKTPNKLSGVSGRGEGMGSRNNCLNFRGR